MARVELKSLLGQHVRGSLLAVRESLGLVNLLHLSGVTILRCENEKRGIHELVRDGYLLDVTAQVGLVPVCQGLVHLLELLELLLGDLIVIKDLNIVLRDALDLSLFIFTEVLGGEFINGVVQDQNFVTLVDILCQDGASKD